MTITTNPTHRKSIAREQVVLSLNRKSIPFMTFDCQMPGLTDLGLPPDAQVYVEAYHQAVYMRFDFGPVDAFAPPQDRNLTEFYDGAPVRFRIKVVDVSQNVGKILADADDVRPSRPDDDSNVESIVPIHLVGGMGQLIWRVTWDNNDPVLELNQAETGIKEAIAGNTLYSSLVMPAVFREITSRVFFEGLDGDTVSKWKLLVSRFQTDPFPDEDDDLARLDWLDVATYNYAEQFRFLDSWHQARTISASREVGPVEEAGR
jgi:hypothetical protein